jgi:two-component system CheB/CheR fusion protein
LARSELHIELKRNIQTAFSEDKQISAEVKFVDEGKPSAVRLDFAPIQEPDTKTRCLLISFVKLEPPADMIPSAVLATETDQRILALGKRLQELERELGATKEYLQSTVEDKESANEELKSANEELQSSNEELQSTNEELETSREEMQSSNEELTTVNEELQNRMVELSQTNDDLHNFLVGLENPVILVGLDLRIRRYTVSAERLLNLIPADVGRPISALDAFCAVDMRTKTSKVIETLAAVEQETLCQNQRWYMLRITPYKTLDHAIRGAVISFIDIDARKRAVDLTRDVGEYASKFLGGIHHPLVLVDPLLRILWANEIYYEWFGAAPEQTIGKAFPTASDPAWDAHRLREGLDHSIRTGEPLRGYAVAVKSPGHAERSLRIGASKVPVANDSTLLLVSIEEE